MRARKGSGRFVVMPALKPAMPKMPDSKTDPQMIPPTFEDLGLPPSLLGFVVSFSRGRCVSMHKRDLQCTLGIPCRLRSGLRAMMLQQSGGRFRFSLGNAQLRFLDDVSAEQRR